MTLHAVDPGPNKPPQVPLLRIIDPGQWAGRPVPPRRWVVEGLIPRGTVTMLSGDGGLGKSLLCQQLLIGATLTGRWIGHDVAQMNALGIFCEDDPEELHRRTVDICAAEGADVADLAPALQLLSRVGDDNILMEFDRRTDQGRKTVFYGQVDQLIQNCGIQLIVVDTAADTFGGNENVRTQVRAFVNALRLWAMRGDGAVVLTAHPSVLGLNTGSGASGSTAWNNTVRSRLYLTRPKPAGDQEEPGEAYGDERILKTMKSNYGKTGGSIALRWANGVFVQDFQGSAGGSALGKYEVDAVLLAALEWLVKNDTRVPLDVQAKNGLVASAKRLPSCRRFSHAVLSAAQERLMESGRIVSVELGPPSKRRLYVRPVNLTYPGEVKSTEPDLLSEGGE